MTDEQIIEGLRTKDQEALLHLQRRYGNYCYCIARSLLGKEESVRECLNDVWLSLWNSHGEVRELKPWLARITRNTALHHIRREHAQKRSACTVLLDELAECVSGCQSMDNRFLKDLLESFLRGLSQEERYVFLRRYWYGYTVAELSRELNWKEARLSSFLFRLRKRLKQHLEREGYRL